MQQQQGFVQGWTAPSGANPRHEHPEILIRIRTTGFLDFLSNGMCGNDLLNFLFLLV